jgi:hypothetical protein
MITAVATLISALAAAGIIEAHKPDPPSPAPVTTTSAPITTTSPPTTTTSPQPPPPPAEGVDTRAAFTVHVGLRPALGQVSEDVELFMNGRSVATWQVGVANPTDLVQVEVAASGRQRYQLKGTYAAVDGFGNTMLGVVKGAGVINITDGTKCIVYYDQGTDTFSLRPMP